ncbi:MAG TPA: tetratricopeptide repeat protein, partial [Anaerolineae bacterium]|nr:tetratricopeptide repeat protein [Anaerolineae bacterium]
RKMLTILFMDAVGSTAITRSLDPEENLEVMAGAIRLLSAPIEEFGGRVLRTMGDGLLAAFGLPSAHENDPDRAVQAALRMLTVAQEYAAELKRKWNITNYQIRIGISTGLVAVGGDGREELSGATVNLAARLEAAAEPGSLLISHGTFQHVQGAFDLLPLPPIEVKGFPEPVPVYQVLAARARSFRSRRRGVEGIETKMVGRDAELRALQNAYHAVTQEGQHRAVTIIGEAGLGKSRLLYEFEKWLDRQPKQVALFRGRALSESRVQPYALLRFLFASHFDIHDDDPAAVVRQKLVAGLGAQPGADGEKTPDTDSESRAMSEPHTTSESRAISESRAHFIGHLLGYDFHDSIHLAPMLANPRLLHDRALSYLGDYFEALCASGPVLMLLEDLHWADDSSLEVIAHLSLTMEHQPLLIVGATRPELFERRPGWYERRAFHRRLELRPLSEQESLGLLADVFQKAENVPAALLELITTNAGGNPFYVEELVKMMVQDGVVVKAGERWLVQNDRLAEERVPATLNGVLQARLDGLPEQERTLLQQASVVGRVFWDVVVIYLNRQVAEEEIDERVEEALLDLQQKEIVFRQAHSVFAGAGEYIFKHALFRQVTYDSVLIKHRRNFHSLVADWLAEHSGERAEEVTGLIANHVERAGRLEEALVYLRRAGEDAIKLFALAEALHFYDQAVALVDGHPAVFTGREVAELRGKRGSVHALAGDFAAAIADTSFALQAAQEAHDLPAQRALLTSLGMVYRRADDYERALSLLNQAVEVARESGDRRAVADTLYHLGSVYWSQGENFKATPPHQEALEICRSLGLADLVAVQATHGRAESHVTDGRPDLALGLFKESLRLSRQVGDRSYEAENLQMIATVNRGPEGLADYPAVEKAAQEALEICRAANLDWHLVPTLDCLSAAYRGLGDYQNAFRRSHEAAQVAEDIGVPRFLSFVFHQLAALYLDLGLFASAEEYLSRALQIGQEAKSAFFLPTIQAGLAVARLRQSNGREPDSTVFSLLEEALVSAMERGQKQQAAHCLEGLAELAIAEGNYEKSVECADRLLTLAKRGAMRERAAQAHRWRGVALFAMGQGEEAGEEIGQAAALAQIIGCPRLLWDMHQTLAHYYRALEDSQMAAFHEEEIQKIVATIAEGLEDEALTEGLPLTS